MNRAWIWGLLVAGCGGQCPEAASASTAPRAEEGGPASPQAKSAEGSREPSEESSQASAPASDAPSAGSDGKPEITNPTFPENATVSQAIAAIPTGSTRANIDQDTLGEPLQNEALYAPCKVGTQHFKVRVAVWNGQAVGVDVTTANQALAACIDKQVRGIAWRDKVRSLNTVDYSM